MSLAVLASRALSGAHAHVVRVETHLGPGLPGFNVVGLPDAGVRESRERCAPPSSTAASSFLPAASPSTCRRPTCPRNRAASTCRSRAVAGIGAVAGTAIRRRRGWQAVRHAGVRVHAGAPGPGGRAVADRRADACHGAAADRAGRGGRSARRDARPARRQRGAGGLGARPAGVVGSQPGGRSGAHHGRACLARRGAGALARAAARALPVRRARPAGARRAGGGRRRSQPADGGAPGAGKSMLAQRLPGLLPPLSRTQALEAAAVAALAGHAQAPAGSRHSGRRIIPCPYRRWWVAAPIPGPERSAWRITACCSWTNSRLGGFRLSVLGRFSDFDLPPDLVRHRHRVQG